MVTREEQHITGLLDDLDGFMQRLKEYIPHENTKALAFIAKIQERLVEEKAWAKETFAEPIARTFNDATKWAYSQGKGTYMAILDKEEHLIKTIKLSKDIIDLSAVKYDYKEAKVTLEMLKRTYVFVLPDGTIVEKPAPPQDRVGAIKGIIVPEETKKAEVAVKVPKEA